MDENQKGEDQRRGVRWRKRESIKTLQISLQLEHISLHITFDLPSALKDCTIIRHNVQTEVKFAEERRDGD